jgi:hypothetical protein
VEHLPCRRPGVLQRLLGNEREGVPGTYISYSIAITLLRKWKGEGDCTSLHQLGIRILLQQKTSIRAFSPSCVLNTCIQLRISYVFNTIDGFLIPRSVPCSHPAHPDSHEHVPPRSSSTAHAHTVVSGGTAHSCTFFPWPPQGQSRAAGVHVQASVGVFLRGQQHFVGLKGEARCSSAKSPPERCGGERVSSAGAAVVAGTEAVIEAVTGAGETALAALDEEKTDVSGMISGAIATGAAQDIGASGAAAAESDALRTGWCCVGVGESSFLS